MKLSKKKDFFLEIANPAKSPVDEDRIFEIVKKTLSKFGERGSLELSIAFVDPSTIQKLNRSRRRKDRVTDILTFSLNGGGEAFGIGGELVMCYDQIVKQAKKFGVSTDEELARTIIHGILHLVGYDHKTKKDERIMFGLQEELLRN